MKLISYDSKILLRLLIGSNQNQSLRDNDSFTKVRYCITFQKKFNLSFAITKRFYSVNGNSRIHFIVQYSMITVYKFLLAEFNVFGLYVQVLVLAKK